MRTQRIHHGRSVGALTATATALGSAAVIGSPFVLAAPAQAATAATTAAALRAEPAASTATVDDAATSGQGWFGYSGAWQVWNGTRAGLYGGSFHYANRPGASARLTFTGTSAVLYGLRQPAGGLATVTIDGRTRGTVNFAASSTQVAVVYSTPALSKGTHTVTLTVSSRTSGRGRTVAIDRAVVASAGGVTTGSGSPAQPAPANPAPAQPAPAGGGVASVTLDDGQEGQFVNAVPALRSAGLTATFYIISDALGWGSTNMDAAQVRQLAGQGFEIGSHTRDHAHLTSLSAAAVEQEFADSVSVLKSRTGVTPATCAYPYGDTSSAVQAIAAKYFTACRGTGGGTNGSSPARYDLSVFYVHTSTTAQEVRAAADAARAAGQWIIFVYHGVGSVGSSDDVTTAQFSEQIAAIKASGIAVRTVAQAAASRR